MKKLTSILVVLALVMTMSVGVFADDTYADEAAANAANIAAGTQINVAGRDYIAIDDASQITDLTGSYYLLEDITWPEKNLGNFSGSFNGGNHTITLSGDSMFGPVGGATSYIANFTIVGDMIITVSGNFGLVGTEVHGGEFKNINTYVEVLANGESAGSLFGTVSSTSRSDTLIVENCVNNALINGTQRSGGFLGSIGSITGMTNITFRNCVNHGEVRSDSAFYSGGILGSIQGIQTAVTVNIENCVNNGAIAAAQSFVGGMVGGVYKANGNADAIPTINLVACTNNGTVSTTAVSNMHYGTGGIFGGVDQSSLVINANACVNNGDVSASQTAGGIIGGISKTGSSKSVKATVTNCVNTGAVTISSDGYCSAIITSENGHYGSSNISPESTIVVTDCLSTVADLEVTDIVTALEDGTVVITPEITNATTVADAAAAVAALTGKVEDTTFTANEGAVRVTVGTHTFENSVCTDCGAPDPYNPIVLENGDEGGDNGGDNGGETVTTTVPSATTKAPTTTVPTTDPVDDEKGGCKGFAAGSVAIISLMTVAGTALLLKKKED